MIISSGNAAIRVDVFIKVFMAVVFDRGECDCKLYNISVNLQNFELKHRDEFFRFRSAGADEIQHHALEQLRVT